MEELSEDIQRQEGKVPETSSAKGHSLQKENTKTIGKAQTPKNKKEASKKKETVKKESPDKKVPKKRPTTKKKTSVKKKAEPQFDEAEIEKTGETKETSCGLLQCDRSGMPWLFRNL